MYVNHNSLTSIQEDSRLILDSVQFQSTGITNIIHQTPFDQRNDVGSKVFGDALLTKLQKSEDEI